MATRLFFHDASNGLTGTFPTGEQSSLTPTYSLPTASTLRTMNTTIGVGPMVELIDAVASAAPQTCFCGFFVSDTFDVNQNVGGGGQTITLNIGNGQSSTNMNWGNGLRADVYVWRPSTGAVVGTVLAGSATLTGCIEPSSSVTLRCNQGTNTGSTQIAALAGDVLICEVFQVFTMTSALSRTGRWDFDGTTVTLTVQTTVTNHASFVEFSADNLTFGTPSGADINGSFNKTLDNVTLSATANVTATATLNKTLANATLSGDADVAISASLNKTLANATLLADADVLVSASFNKTLANATLSATGGVIASGAFNRTLDDATLAATAEVDDPVLGDLTGTFNKTLADATLSATAFVAVSGTFNRALAPATLAAQGSVAISASLNVTLDPVTLNTLVITQTQAPQGRVRSMNESLYEYLGSVGFTQPCLPERIMAYLKEEIVNWGASPAPNSTIDDLWYQLGVAAGPFTGTTTTEIQMQWAASKGATGTTWNDLMSNLP